MNSKFRLLLGVTASMLLPAACASSESAPPTVTTRACVAPARMRGAKIALAPAFGGATFNQPIEMIPGPGGRFYVLEQPGLVKVVDPGSQAVTTALDLTASIVAGGEAGLLGIAFDPAFAQNGFVYLGFTAPLASPPPNVVFESVIARFESKDGGKTIDKASQKRLLAVAQPFSNHNGGKIAFGPDGFLYISLGDGGSGGDPSGNGQNIGVLLGKILRIDPKGGDPYGIPPDNPFVSGGGRPEIFAYGLRNPWKFSFDAATGDLWAGDVGQSKYEEIDRIVRGGNYGWRTREGKHCYGAAECDATGFIDPVVEYGRSDGVSVTGGYVYRGSRLPSLFGKFLFGDFGSGRIWAVDKNAAGENVPNLLLESNAKISSFGQDAAGEVYVVDYATGTVQSVVAGTDGADAGTPSTLSSTGCLDPRTPDRPPAGLVPYTVNSPLWSDGATKDRWVFVPEGAKVGVKADGDMDLPPGTVTVKTFSVGGKRIETRLFVRYDDGEWAGFSYEWADDQSDATLLADGKTKPLATGETWTYPSRAQCFSCHTPAAGFTLGLEARQLNRDEGGQNQLARFAPMLAQPIAPEAFPPLRAADSPGATAEERARGYLHANCSMCHREGAGAGAATLDLRIQRTLAETRTCNAAVQAGDLSIAGARVLAPGDPLRSMIALRMRALDDNRMPNLATRRVDATGVAAVEAWISGLTGCP